jgi:hypothetical protein
LYTVATAGEGNKKITGFFSLSPAGEGDEGRSSLDFCCNINLLPCLPVASVTTMALVNGTGQWHWSVMAVASFTALRAFKNPNKFLKVPLRGTFKNLFGFLSLNRLY